MERLFPQEEINSNGLIRRESYLTPGANSSALGSSPFVFVNLSFKIRGHRLIFDYPNAACPHYGGKEG
jgi:hypothetical protein